VKEKRKPRTFRYGLHVRASLEGEDALWLRRLVTQLKDGFAGHSYTSYSNVEDFPLTICQDGFAVRTIDSSRVLMADLRLDKHDFTEFAVEKLKAFKPLEVPITIRLNFEDLLYALAGVSRESSVDFEFELLYLAHYEWRKVGRRKPEKCPKCGAETLYNMLPPDKRGKKGNLFKCRCGWRGKVRRWSKKQRFLEGTWSKDTRLNVKVSNGTTEMFQIAVLENTDEPLPCPKAKLDAEVKFVVSDFRTLLERLKKKCTSARLITERKGLTVQGFGETVKTEFTLPRGCDSILKIVGRGKQKASYTIANLLQILPKKGIADIATIEYSSDMPLKLSFQPKLANSKAEFWMAPRIETD